VKPPTLSRSSVLCRCGGASLQGVEKQYSVRPYADAFCSFLLAISARWYYRIRLSGTSVKGKIALEAKVLFIAFRPSMEP
jgi:hypothetical protein